MWDIPKRPVSIFWIVCCLSFMASTARAQPPLCPDYLAVLDPPALEGPQQASFRHRFNRWLSRSYAPYHMVHDQLVPAGTPATMVGKFDYNKLFHKDLEDEDVHVYLYGTGMSEWEYLGKHRTDSAGKIYVPVQKDVGEYLVSMIVEGDLSAAHGYLSVVDPSRQAVLFDIDGTLTRHDFEVVGEYLGIATARAHEFAIDVIERYIEKGYQIVYLTARPYWTATSTRIWFEIQGIFGWHLRMNPQGKAVRSADVESYKIDSLIHLLDEIGLDIVRAYGNATTDISAYEAVGIPKSETYIIGPHAGLADTQPIYEDYAEHYDTVVESTPVANCISPAREKPAPAERAR